MVNFCLNRHCLPLRLPKPAPERAQRRQPHAERRQGRALHGARENVDAAQGDNLVQPPPRLAARVFLLLAPPRRSGRGGHRFVLQGLYDGGRRDKDCAGRHFLQRPADGLGPFWMPVNGRLPFCPQKKNRGLRWSFRKPRSFVLRCAATPCNFTSARASQSRPGAPPPSLSPK